MALAVRRRALAEEGHRDARLPLIFMARARPTATCAMSRHRDHPDAAEGAIAEVHVAVLASGHPAGPAHVVGQVAIGGDSPDEMGPEVAVQDAHPISGSRTNEAPTEIASCPRPS